MAFDDFYSNLLFFLRWLHIFFGILWIGHLYFFNFTNSAFQAVLPAELKPKVNPLLMLRALFWFRWGAMLTFLIGIALLLVKYFGGNLWLDEAGHFSQRSMWVTMGGLLGTIMWFNVWFIIWPSQKKLIAGMLSGQPHPDAANIQKRAGLFSKINTFLSGPMLFGMIAPNNYPAMNLITLVVVVVFALAIIKYLYTLAPKVGTKL